MIEPSVLKRALWTSVYRFCGCAGGKESREQRMARHLQRVRTYAPCFGEVFCRRSISGLPSADVGTAFSRTICFAFSFLP